MDEISPSFPAFPDTNNENNSTNRNESTNEIKIRSIKNVPIELTFILYFFAYSLVDATLTNQLLYQTCRVTLGINETTCSQLGTHNESNEIKNLESKVQPYVANIQMIRSLLENIIPAILSFFIGPWSDKNGRKPIILAALFGSILLYSCITIISAFSLKFSVNPWYYLIGSIFTAFLGGNCALFTGMFSYISDIATNIDRDFRMSLLESSVYLGIFFGSISTSYLLKWTNTTIVFGIGAINVIIAFLYVLLGIKESLHENNELRIESKFRELFRIDLITELFSTCFKRRPNYDRAIIWLLLSILAAIIFILNGSVPVYYLFLREKFEWTIKEYTIFEATSILIQFFGGVVGTYFFLKFISGQSIAIIGLISYFIHSTIIAFGPSSIYIYFAISITFVRAAASPMLRAMLSNSVADNEVGKVFSLATSLESLTPLISAPLYTIIYNSTLLTFPGFFSLVSAGIYLYCIIALIIVIFLKRFNTAINYENINE